MIREYYTKSTRLKVRKETPLKNTDKSTGKVKTEASISHGQRCGTPTKMYTNQVMSARCVKQLINRSIYHGEG